MKVDVNVVNLHLLPWAAFIINILQGVNLRLKQTPKTGQRNHTPSRLLALLSEKRVLLHEVVGAKRVNACKE